MASITRQPDGRRMIQFTDANGKRRTLRLGKCSMKNAAAVKLRVEQLVAAQITGHPPDRDTMQWVSRLDSILAERLSRSGLIEPPESVHLDTFITGYIASRHDVKPNTKKIWRQTLRHLVSFFDDNTSLRDVTKGDAKGFRLHLISQGLADATVRKHCGFAKHFFAEAIDRRLLEENPFAGMATSPVGNPARQYFVTHDEAQKVLDACPDAEWRLIFALSRFGGLRCPSEHMSLRWEDIHWEQERLTVHSSKTERYEGGASRVIPLFGELRPYLEEAFGQAEEGAEYVIATRRKGGNLRTQLGRIVKRAGLKPWPRIFHNLRASRQTELEAQHPTHVVCSWIGNSPAVAQKHYLQVTDDHFEKALRNALQQPAVLPRTGSQTDFPQMKQPPVMQGVAGGCTVVQNPLAGVDGNRTHLATFQTPHWV